MKRILGAWVGVACVALILAALPSPAAMNVPQNAAARLAALEALTGGQMDTNAVTVPANYTPEYAGQALIGQLSWSNSVWIARSTAAGDWQFLTMGASTTTTTSTTSTTSTTTTSTTSTSSTTAVVVP